MSLLSGNKNRIADLLSDISSSPLKVDPCSYIVTKGDKEIMCLTCRFSGEQFEFEVDKDFEFDKLLKVAMGHPAISVPYRVNDNLNNLCGKYAINIGSHTEMFNDTSFTALRQFLTDSDERMIMGASEYGIAIKKLSAMDGIWISVRVVVMGDGDTWDSFVTVWSEEYINRKCK